MPRSAPWTTGGPSFGFGAGAAHLPQPSWFGSVSVEAQERDAQSTLSLYRQALSWRHRLRAAENLAWKRDCGGHVLHFERPGGWQSVTNFGPDPVALPKGTVLIASAPVEGDLLPADTTVWLLAPP